MTDSLLEEEGYAGLSQEDLGVQSRHIIGRSTIGIVCASLANHACAVKFNSSLKND